VKETFRRHFPDPTPKKQRKEGAEESIPRAARQDAGPFQKILAWFSKGNTVETSDEIPYSEYCRRLETVDGLKEIAAKHLKLTENDGLVPGMELVLEGLHQHSMVSKWEDKSRTAYRDMLKAMFDRMPSDDSD
jgi:magnesium chelatase subunit I